MGSEMCIRDRREREGDREQKRKDKARRSRSKAKQNHSLLPSYTLPRPLYVASSPTPLLSSFLSSPYPSFLQVFLHSFSINQTEQRRRTHDRTDKSRTEIIIEGRRSAARQKTRGGGERTSRASFLCLPSLLHRPSFSPPSIALFLPSFHPFSLPSLFPLTTPSPPTPRPPIVSSSNPSFIDVFVLSFLQSSALPLLLLYHRPEASTSGRTI